MRSASQHNDASTDNRRDLVSKEAKTSWANRIGQLKIISKGRQAVCEHQIRQTSEKAFNVIY